MTMQIPTKPKPAYLRWAQVWQLCQRNNISKYTAEQLFGSGSSARIFLGTRTRPVYDRRTVLGLLGLTDD
jgi:hypothetical protein